MITDGKFGFAPSKFNGTEHVFGLGAQSPDIPKSYSYKKFLPKCVDQGNESICVPCSVSTYLNWKENLKTGSKKDNKIDYHEIYDIKSGDGDGMTFKEAFSYLRHHGVSSKAGNLKIEEYALIKNMIDLKYALVMNGPCLGALPVYSDDPDFWNKKPGYSLCGYHAISIAGYTEDGFIIRNSWGTSFGNDGYSILPFEDFLKLIEVWTIVS